MLGCKRQRGAWDANALLLAPIFAPVSEPLPADRRARGEFGDASFARARILAAYEESGVDPEFEVQRATKDLRAAAASPLNRVTRDVGSAYAGGLQVHTPLHCDRCKSVTVASSASDNAGTDSVSLNR